MIESMLKYVFFIVTGTIHTECNKNCPPSCIRLRKMQPFQKPQISCKGR